MLHRKKIQLLGLVLSSALATHEINGSVKACMQSQSARAYRFGVQGAQRSYDYAKKGVGLLQQGATEARSKAVAYGSKSLSFAQNHKKAIAAGSLVIVGGVLGYYGRNQIFQVLAQGKDKIAAFVSAVRARAVLALSGLTTTKTPAQAGMFQNAGGQVDTALEKVANEFDLTKTDMDKIVVDLENVLG